jgi:hypothetical protein
MTREEFNEILSEVREKEIAKVCESFKDTSGMSQENFLVKVMASSITASESIVLSALEKAGVLKYDD